MKTNIALTAWGKCHFFCIYQRCVWKVSVLLPLKHLTEATYSTTPNEAKFSPEVSLPVPFCHEVQVFIHPGRLFSSQHIPTCRCVYHLTHIHLCPGTCSFSLEVSLTWGILCTNTFLQNKTAISSSHRNEELWQKAFQNNSVHFCPAPKEYPSLGKNLRWENLCGQIWPRDMNRKETGKGVRRTAAWGKFRTE